MDSNSPKPKLVFFQYKYDSNLPQFLLDHKNEHVACLSHFFEVAVINEDSDYHDICDRHAPDLALFESGLNHFSCRKPNITNVRGYPQVPRLGFHNIDAWCETRAGVLSDMDHLGIDTFFAISTTAAEHTPAIADRLFIWPNFINTSVFRDYGEPKLIPVLFTGAMGPQYPWRQRIFKTVSDHYPSLCCPHPGYYGRSMPVQTLHGEQYARTINASWFVPACGTVAKEFVRKHLEIPACKGCLITERSPALEAAGFRDQINCVFVEERDVLDKMRHLFENPSKLEQIIEAGFALVHSQHTSRQRSQVLQWFTLQKELQPNQRIIQTSPFGPLAVDEKSSDAHTYHVHSHGLHLALLQQGDDHLFSGRYGKAEADYRRCLNYMRGLPEAKFRLALCSLYKGNAPVAERSLTGLIRFILFEYKALDPDPVEWAYYIISLVCLDKLKDARERAGEFPHLRHPELDRARWVAGALGGAADEIPAIPVVAGNPRASIHSLPIRHHREWLDEISLMLRASGRADFAKILDRRLPPPVDSANPDAHGLDHSMNQGAAPRPPHPGVRSETPCFQRASQGFSPGFQAPREFFRKVQSKLKRVSLHYLHLLEGRVGFFLPYAMSAKRSDEFYRTIHDLMRQDDVATALIIGAASGLGGTEALLSGAFENPLRPRVFCVNRATRGFERLESRFPANQSISHQAITPPAAGGFPAALAKCVSRVNDENGGAAYDLVLIENPGLLAHLDTYAETADEVRRARLVCLDDIGCEVGHRLYQSLLDDPAFILFVADAGRRNGYAIFRKAPAIALQRAM